MFSSSTKIQAQTIINSMPLQVYSPAIPPETSADSRQGNHGRHGTAAKTSRAQATDSRPSRVPHGIAFEHWPAFCGNCLRHQGQSNNIIPTEKGGVPRMGWVGVLRGGCVWVCVWGMHQKKYIKNRVKGNGWR